MIRSPHSVFSTLASFVAILCPQACAGDSLSLQQIIENVRRNELLYANTEVAVTVTYRVAQRSAVTFANPSLVEVTASTATIRSVAQGDLFRVDVDGSYTAGDDDLPLDRVTAFDGNTTRVLDRRAIGNVVHGRRNDPDLVRPHMLLLHNQHYGIHLSTYLSAHEAIQTMPGAKWPQGVNLKVSYDGEENFAGLVCHRVTATTLGGGNEYGRWQLWLAEERNYIPVRLQTFNLSSSASIPDSEGRVEDFTEAKSGIWFPTAATVTAFDTGLFAVSSVQKMNWQLQYVTADLSLDPAYAVDHFQDVRFPDGTAVYEVTDENIVSSYIQGAPRRGSERNAGGWKWWLVVGNLVVVAVLAVFAAWRARRDTRARSATVYRPAIGSDGTADRTVQ